MFGSGSAKDTKTKKGPVDKKKNQKDYEKKVKNFWKYCIAFQRGLRVKNKDGKLKTIRDVRKCFNDSFKGYYGKLTKKFGSFSRTTKVLKEMDKKLKESKEMLLSEEKAAGTLKKAFEYTREMPKNDLSKRSVIDDKGIYKFFNDTNGGVSKAIDSIYKKVEKEQNDFVELVKELFEKVDKTAEKTEEKLVGVQEKAQDQKEQIQEAETKHEDAEQKLNEGESSKEDKAAVNKMEAEVDDAKKENIENIENITDLEDRLNKVNKRKDKISAAINIADSKKRIEKLKKLFNIEENNIDIMEKKAKSEMKELHDEIIKINKRIAKLREELQASAEKVDALVDFLLED